MTTHAAPNRGNWFTVLGLLLGGIIFVPFFLNLTFGLFSLLNTTPPNWFGAMFFFPGFLISIAFSYAPVYYAVTVLGIGFILVALKRGEPNRVLRGLLLLGLLAILLDPIVLPYETAVVAADGYEMFSPTKPGILAGVPKRAAMTAERLPCSYQLLGWSDDGALYYGAVCQANEPVYWAYTPGQEAERVSDAPEMLNRNVVPQKEALDWVYAGGVRPKSAEPWSRDLAIRHHEALLSGDGRYLALIPRHIYGPEDVIVVQK